MSYYQIIKEKGIKENKNVIEEKTISFVIEFASKS